MARDFRKSSCVYRSRTWMPTERSTPASRFSREGVPPIIIAEIPRPLWHHPLADWDDDDPPPLPPRFEPDAAPRRRPRRSATIVVSLVTAFAVAGSVVGLSKLPEMADRSAASSGAQGEDTALSSRIDSAMANLPQEDLSASERRQALIRAVRPQLMSSEVDGAASDR
jgi:hypothetical protein